MENTISLEAILRELMGLAEHTRNSYGQHFWNPLPSLHLG